MANTYDVLTSYQKETIKNRLKVEWTYASNAIKGKMAFFILEYKNSQVFLDEIKK